MSEAPASSTLNLSGRAPSSLEPFDFDCPRCGAAVRGRFWGPCEPCRGELRATQGGEAKDVEIGAYEPKMNVVPNQVATKD